MISWISFTKLIDEALANDEFESIVLDLQNEPLLDAELEHRVAYIRKHQRKRIFIGITTNGLLLTPSRFLSLVESGIDRIVFSLNAIDQTTFASLVPRVKFEKLLENVQAVLRLPGASERLKLSFGATGGNVGQAADFITHMEQQDLQYRVFSLHDRLKQLDGDFLELVTSPVCHLPLYSMAILLDGSAILCCQDWEPRRVLGNVLTDSIRAVWGSNEYREIRSDILDRRKLPDSPCAGCDAPFQLTSKVNFNYQQMHRIGLRFFGKRCAEVNRTPLQVAPRGKKFVLYNGRTNTLAVLDRDEAEAVEAILHKEPVPYEASRAAAERTIATELARSPSSPLIGRRTFITLDDGAEFEATIQRRSGNTLYLELRDGSQTLELVGASVQVPVIEGTVMLKLSGSIQPSSSPAEIILCPDSEQALDVALDAEGHW